MKIPKDRSIRVETLAKVANIFGGTLAYSTSNYGAYVRIGIPPFHVDIHPGDSIVKKGGQAIVAKGYMMLRAEAYKRNPELRHLVPKIESMVHKTITLN